MGRLEYEVRELILDQSRSLATFARDIGISKNTLYSALNNGFAGSTLATLKPIVEALGLDIAEFAEGKAVPLDQTRKSALVPFFESITTDKPADFDHADDVFPIPGELYRLYPNAFMLRVRDTSMNRLYPAGSYALVNPCDSIDSASDAYVIAVGNGAATIKHVRVLSNGAELIPNSDDPTHHSVVYDRAQQDTPDIRVIGRVVWHCPPFSAKEG